MTKKLTLIYGEDTAQMKQLSAALRADKTMKTRDFQLRSALAFTPAHVEPCDSVIVIGEFPAVTDAYADQITTADELTAQAAAEAKAKGKETGAASATPTPTPVVKPAKEKAKKNKKAAATPTPTPTATDKAGA